MDPSSKTDIAEGKGPEAGRFGIGLPVGTGGIACNQSASLRKVEPHEYTS